MNGLLARIGLAAIGFGIAAWFGFQVGTWRANSHQLKAAKAQIESIQAEHAIELKAAQDAAYDYQKELDRIRRTPASPRPVVRMCNVPPKPAAEEPTPAPTDGATTPREVVPEPARPDIGPDLYALAQRCDEVSAELRALQSWVNQVTTNDR